MKQGRIIMAIKALDRLKTQPMALQLSYKIYRLRKSLQPHWDWQNEQELELIRKHATLNDDGGMVFSAEGRIAFDSAILEISNVEVEQDWDPVVVEISDDLKISVEDLETLEGFINIEDRRE